MFAFFDKINARVTIGARMAMLGLMAMVPILLLGSLLVMTHMDSIRFAQHELAGVRTLDAIAPALFAGAGGDGLNEIESATAKAAGIGGKDDLSNLTDEDLLNKAAALFNTYTDKSQLILDPELPSFYTMDATDVKLPEAMRIGRALYNTREAPDTVLEHQISEITFANDVQAVVESLQRAGKNMSGGKLAPDTFQAMTAFRDAGMAFDQEHSQANYDAFIDAARSLYPWPAVIWAGCCNNA